MGNVFRIYVHANYELPTESGCNNTGNVWIDTDVIVQSNFATNTDATAATRFAQSDAGTLGLTFSFEARPNSNAGTYAYNNVLEAIGYTAVNRNITVGFVSSSYTTFKAVTKNMSSVWVSKSDGSGNLQSAQASTLTTVLNEAPTTPDCNGFIASMCLGVYMACYYESFPNYPPYNYNLFNSAPHELWFDSVSTELPSSGAYYITDLTTSNNRVSNYYFFGQNNVRLKSGYSSLY